MKRILTAVSTLIFTLSLFTQCEKNKETALQDGERFHITFTSSATKCELTDPGEGDLKFTWEANDKIQVFDGTKYCGTLVIKSGDEGKAEAQFEGDITKPSGSTIKFMYFGSELTAPSAEDLTVDFFNQDGDIAWCQKRLISSFETVYSGTEYSGEMKVEFAIGHFKFANGKFDVGTKVSVRGLAQKIKVNKGGQVEYIIGTGLNCSEFTYTSGNSFYVAMPSATNSNKICFVNEDKKTAKKFDTEIENGTFYRADDGSGIEVIPEGNSCTVTYKANVGDGQGTVNFVDPIVEENKVNHDIILKEPIWIGEGSSYTFLGWSETENDKEGRYTSQNRETGAHVLDIAGRTSATLYAIWEDVKTSGPWVDYEHYELAKIVRVDYLDGWKFNEYIKYMARTDIGYDKLNIPIRNLEKGKWYSLKFGEELTGEEGKNLFHGLGVFANIVRETKSLSEDYKTMLTFNKEGENQFVWVHGLGKYDTSDYTSTQADSIIFKATSTTMWWIWDLSKHNNNNHIMNYLYVVEPKFTEIKDVSGECIAFRQVSFHGFRVSAFSDDEHKTDNAGHKDGQGYSTYSSYAKDNDFITLTTICMINTNEKINIPITNLQPNTTYSLSFDYKRESEIDDELYSGYSFCYGVVSAKNTTIDDEGLTPGSGGYSSNKTDRTFSDTITFTTGENQTTMYWVWSMSKLKNDYWNKHKITITSFKVKKD